MCIDIVEIWFRITKGQISSNFDGVICPRFLFPDDNFSKCQGILTKHGTCIDIIKIWFGMANGQILLFLTELSARNMIMAVYYRLTFLFT